MIDEKKLIEAYHTLWDEIGLDNEDKICFDNHDMNLKKAFRTFHELIDDYKKLSLENKTSNWIPCSRELPPKPECGLWQAYIVQQENVFYPYVAYFTDDGWMDDDLDEIRNVLAWMPLPEAYKGE